ncbi:MAG: CoA-acylating methylmalonate-semialdehyde dehydrogenase, partial [Burkholderiaceae bacterium]
MTVIGHWINGALVTDSARTQAVFNPATGASTKQVALASKATVEQAIANAQAAFPAWRNTPPGKRAQIMFRLKQLLDQHAGEICALITDEHGKVLNDAAGELQRGIEVVEYMCGVPDLLKGEHSKNVGPAIDSWSERQALGVVAGITPFNFPAMVPLWITLPAIACGNTIVLKPSERDPSCMLLIAQLAKQAGLPDGVLNVVNGDKEAVDTLLTDPRIQAIGFVGSTNIAEYIYTTGCANGKRVKALGGAKNHAIIMPDADIDNAATALMGAAYGSCGERCMAISVAVAVGDAVADALVANLKARLATLKVGVGTDNGNDMGPLITAQHRAKVIGYINSAEEQGATVAVDGRKLTVPGFENGYFVGGTLLDHMQPGMKAYEEEIFGPVLCVLRVGSMAEAMQLIDDHEYGNGTCIFTRDGEAARYFSDNI